MNNYPPSPYPGQNQPSWPGSPQTPSQPNFIDNSPWSQAGSIAQPDYPAPSPDFVPRNRKKRTPLWIGLIVVLLLAVGGTFYYLRSIQTDSTPQKTLNAYCDGIKNNNAQEIYDILTSEQQAQTSVSKIQQNMQLTTFLIGGFKNCLVNSSSISQTNSTATGTLMLFPGRGPTTTVTLHLIDENRQWKLTQNTIFAA